METEDSEMCRWYQNNTCKEPCGDCSTTIVKCVDGIKIILVKNLVEIAVQQ